MTRTPSRPTPRRKRSPEDTAGVSQVDAAVEFLRARIMDLTLEPGSRIDERLLISDFGLGRTPAREALNRLAMEGFVQLRANRGGAFVAPLGFEDFGQLIEAHQFCEAMLSHRLQIDYPGLLEKLEAIQQRYVVAVNQRDYLRITDINTEFHMCFYETMRNQLIADYALKILRLVSRVLNWTYRNELPETEHQNEQFTLNLAQHDEIIDTVRRKDLAKLSVILPEHAAYVQVRLIHILNRRAVRADFSPFPPTQKTEAEHIIG
ncbi:GntR family transcriptional regulator [Paenirhodobacter populi]|uniref:GntR family transcriptional regulator n=1 Tax=Paenirhodobacter populi TaxID=2306993 RepID=A0A443INN6_9RHOB|nr:GntR family transcriptional regulator [Sinirhodobacter populi]RWR07223.1 GntR family transcriptional regulator [Sinirhodobacter populi]RWR07397.1 GntR family transcriptional regulator [Sinirhodobacter populi]